MKSRTIFDEYMHMYYLAKIKDIIDGSDSSSVYVTGDYKSDVTRNAAFGRELNTWCTTLSLELLPFKYVYYVSKVQHLGFTIVLPLCSASWLYHCVTTNTGKILITDIKVLKVCTTFAHKYKPVDRQQNIVG